MAFVRISFRFKLSIMEARKDRVSVSAQRFYRTCHSMFRICFLGLIEYRLAVLNSEYRVQ